MRVALRGKPPSQSPVPAGVAQVDGDWMYEEYVGGDAVQSVDIEENRSIWDRLFGNWPKAPAAPGTQQPPQEDIYRGG